MLRTVGIATGLSMLMLLPLGCRREEEPQSAYQQPGYGQQPPPGYGQQPGYGQPGYQQPPPGGTAPAPGAAPPPGTAPPPGGTAPAPANTAPGGLPWPFPFPFPGAGPAPGGGGQQPGGGGGQQPGGGGQASGGHAQALDPMAAQAAAIPLGQMAQTEAPGMQPLGDPFAGNFQQGQILEQAFEMLPNKCYTVLGTSQGITELDIQLVAMLPLAPQVVAQDNTQGHQAVLGGRGQCYNYMAPMGVNAKAVLIARTGSGVAAGRIYVK